MELTSPDDPTDSGVPFFNFSPGHRGFALRVLDDSLVGDEIAKGDVVIVDGDASFIDGNLYVIRIAEMVMVKHVYIMNRDRYKLVLGPSEIEVDRSEIEILGRVTGRVREH